MSSVYTRSVGPAPGIRLRAWLTPALLVTLLVTLLITTARTVIPADTAPVQVHLADGSSFPLLDWTFSYEYTAFRQGDPHGPPARREVRELWVGKRSVPIQARTLALLGGQNLALTDSGGKTSTLRGVAPHADLLLPEGRKGLLVIPRSLDLRGTTLGGTNRQFCLLSYSTLVSCGGEDSDRVVRVEFPSEATP